MAKAEWVELSKSGGSGNDSVAVSSKTPHTGREARTSIITWVAEGVAKPIERTVIQEGADAYTKSRVGTHIFTKRTKVFITGESNEEGLAFIQTYGEVPYDIDSVITVAGQTVFRKDDSIINIPYDPGKHQKYNFTVGLTLRPDDIEPPLKESHETWFQIVGSSGNGVSIRITYSREGEAFIIVPEGDIVLNAKGESVTVQVTSNTSWVIE